MMDRKDPIEALKGYYGGIDKADAPAGLACRKREGTRSMPGSELLKVATACAAGIAVAFVIASPETVAPALIPAATGSTMGIREQMVRNGIDPEEVIGADERRSQLEGGKTWRV
jgi:hypothetical protein